MHRKPKGRLQGLTVITYCVIVVIQSFADAETEKLYRGLPSRRLPPDLHSVMHRKLVMLNAAAKLEDLRVPPGNRSKP